MKKLSFICYSHSSYSDAWPVFFGQLKKHCSYSNLYLFTDSYEDEKIPEDVEVVLYKDEDSYQQRVFSCLETLDEEIVVFCHEDMPLYSDADKVTLSDFSEMVENDEVQFIKLLRGGYENTKFVPFSDSRLVESPSTMIFTVQPTICKLSNLMKIYEITQGDNMWEFEQNTAFTALREGFTGAMAYQVGDKKRGAHHWDSSVFPYVATAIVKGQWNFSEYPELHTLLSEYRINPELRGVV
jgi:hypothetical protein